MINKEKVNRTFADMNGVKREIKSFLPDPVLYFYYVLREFPQYVKTVWNTRNEKYPRISFYDDRTTVDLIVEEHKSLCRFGDGEFMWMLGETMDSFQESSVDLGKTLQNVFQSKDPNLLIGIPYSIVDADKCNLNAKMHWKIIKSNFFRRLLPFADLNRTYCNASITRPYIDYHDREYSRTNFENLRRIWESRDIVIVEGRQTKLGVGNDLLSNAESIRRIVCPATNAFSRIREIEETIVRLVRPSDLILAALGPTATILAAEMCGRGYQVVDIGHVDVEYVWYLRHELLRKPIEGKYVNESGVKGCSDYYDSDPDYLNSIIATIQ